MKAITFFLMSFPLCMLLWQGCGSPPPIAAGQVDPALTGCNAKVAQILVGDGYLQILCGCTGATETSGKIYSVSTNPNLTCHLATSDTMVFFYYLGTVLQHQIVPTGANTFVPSPVSDPTLPTPIRSYVVAFPTPGLTYSFQDAYSSLTGQIFVP